MLEIVFGRVTVASLLQSEKAQVSMFFTEFGILIDVSPRQS